MLSELRPNLAPQGGEAVQAKQTGIGLVARLAAGDASFVAEIPAAATIVAVVVATAAAAAAAVACRNQKPQLKPKTSTKA